MSAPLGLNAVAAEWLKQCGPHDYGVDTAGCNCLEPGKDPRPVISWLVTEVERYRREEQELERIADGRTMVVEPYGECRDDCECAHESPRACGCHVTGEEAREWIRRLEAENERLRGAIARVEALCSNPDGGAPPDGTIVFAHYTGGHQDIDQERIWQRSDGDDQHPDGDWYLLGENAGRHHWGEVLWLDDPACDRGHVHLEWLIPVEEIDLALRGQVTG